MKNEEIRRKAKEIILDKIKSGLSKNDSEISDLIIDEAISLIREVEAQKLQKIKDELKDRFRLLKGDFIENDMYFNNWQEFFDDEIDEIEKIFKKYSEELKNDK
jgi:hypothetical protein